MNKQKEKNERNLKGRKGIKIITEKGKTWKTLKSKK